MRKTTVAALLCALLLLPAAAGSSQAATLAEAQALLQQATDGFFDESLPNTTIRGLLDRSDASFALLADPCQSAYWRGRVQYLYGFVEQADRQSKRAEARFQASLELATAFSECGESSEGYRLMADAQAQLLLLNNLAYMMTHGLNARRWAERAVDLDPNNPLAQLSLALYYKNAPAVAGGNPEESRRLLHALEGRDDLERADRFSVHTWLGIAYKELEDRERARAYLSRAQAEYPGNTWLRRLLAEL